jgi:hypothetical protein
VEEEVVEVVLKSRATMGSWDPWEESGFPVDGADEDHEFL